MHILEFIFGFSDYPTLREHFHTEHYLCEEGDCADAQFTNAFRSDIDMKSHQAHEHSKAQTKLQSRQERTLNIDINFVPRPNCRSQRGGYADQFIACVYRSACPTVGTNGGSDNDFYLICSKLGQFHKTDMSDLENLFDQPDL